LKIADANELKKKFLERLEQYYNNGKTRDGLHVSDLVFCLRQSYFRKTNPKPHSLRTLQFFIDGATRHSALQDLLGLEREVEVERFGVVGHVDVMAGGVPVELKTTRARSAVPDHYFRQLGYYAVLCGVCEGVLVVQRINCRDGEEPWEFYHVKWSREEVEGLERELRHRANLLRGALEKRDPSFLPVLGSDMRWKCRWCDYVDECEKKGG